MNLASIYREVEKRIEQLDFSRLWRGFSPLKFALYTEDECFFDGQYIEKTGPFCANTSIEYNGEYIAIWNLMEEPSDLDALAASIVHEMFHAFQNISGERRFPDEREALFRYRYEAENLTAKLREAELLRAVLLEEDREAWEEFLRLRAKRRERFPYEYEYEARVEQIEGTANYVEVAALIQLDAEKGRLAWEKLLDRIARPEQYFPVRIVSYAIGAAVLSCLRKCPDMDWESFAGEPFSCGMLDAARGEAESVPRNARLEEALARYQAETHRIIEAAVRKDDCVLRGKFPLVSVNIYDARREGSRVTSHYFVMYRDGGETKTLYGDFVAEVDAGYHVLAVWRQ